MLEEYIPIVGPNGTVPAVFEIYRDAQPILDAVATTTTQVIQVVLLAALILGALLLVIFQAAQRRLSRQTAALFEASGRDALTGLLNHGTTVARLADLLEQTRGGHGCVGMALIDIDNFRLVNDTYGHLAGDRALLEVAGILRDEFAETSILGRYGPDEFLVVAPPDHSAGLEMAIERLRDRIAELTLQFGDSERLPVTVSAGICYSPADGEAATELLAIAAVVLGEAKASGGNGVRVADAAPAELGPAERSGFDVLAGPGHRRRHQGPIHQAPLGGRRPLQPVPGRSTPGRPRAAPDDRDCRPAPRRRQDRHPRRHPAQAGPADRRRADDRPAARGTG